MRSKIKWVCAVTVVALALAGCTRGASNAPPATDSGSDTTAESADRTFYWITHGSGSDPFWVGASAGADQAQADLELAVGVARGFSDVLFVTLGTGVGGALALHGEVEMGTAGFIGEIGHVTYRQASSRPCGCGHCGCLETYAGAAGMLAESARRGLASELAGDTSASGRLGALFDAARGGDGVAADIVSQAGGALGVVGWLSTFLAPDLVVIGGGVTKGFDVLDPAFRAELAHNVRIVRPPTVRLTRQPDLAGAIGAAIWAGQTATATSRPKRSHA